MSFMRKWQKKAQFSQTKMTKHIFPNEKRLTMAAIFLLIGLITISSCKKVESDLGVDILPSSDQLGLEVDTLELNSFSSLEDSLRSDEFSSNMLGSYNDETFGKTKASIYTQLRLSVIPTFTDLSNTVVDSVVLSLNIVGFYGEHDDQTFEVYELTDDIYRDSNYYTNTDKANNGINLVKPGFETFAASLTNSPVIEGEVLDPQMRIRLNESFGDMILNSDSLTTDAIFAEYFKGLFITVNNPIQSYGQGGIYSFDMENNETKVTIYYHNSTDTTSFEMPINDKCARFTSMEHDYTGTKIEQQLADSTLGNEFYYVQAGQGLVGNIAIPSLLNLTNDGPVIINRAELYLPVQYYSASAYSPPTRTLAYGLNDENEIYTMPDFNLGVSIYGGNYNDEKKAYVFNIIRYIQDVVNGTVRNNPIRILPTGSVVTPHHVILSGKNSPNREKPYLIVYYTKYN
jgi:hypothetical protein